MDLCRTCTTVALTLGTAACGTPDPTRHPESHPLTAQGTPYASGPQRTRPGGRAVPGDGDDLVVPGGAFQLVEGSIAQHPADPRVLLCGHNAFDGRERAVHLAWSFDAGASWETSLAFDATADPAVAVDHEGTFYAAYVKDGDISGGGLRMRVSSDQGATWSVRTITTDPADKPHLACDTQLGSPLRGNLYASWTRFRGGTRSDILVSASSDGGRTWPGLRNVSGPSVVNKQGSNLQVGPSGELYCCWAEFGANFSDGERALGFNRSLDGGRTFGTPLLIASDVRGAFPFALADAPDFKINSFPSMAVDRSGGPRNGWIYVFWTNVGVPGVNQGDLDIYMLRSRDGGLTWDAPQRVNEDSTTNAQWQVWATCDPASGELYALYFDRREDPDDRLARAYVARSTDGGSTWRAQPVGDVPFALPVDPTPSGLRYLGDYHGIVALRGRVFPLWSDSRTSPTAAYVSPLVFDLEPPILRCPAPTVIEADRAGGLSASAPEAAAFLAGARALDALDPAPTLTSDAPAFFPLGTTEITFTATDAAGLSARCSTQLTVVDTTAPELELVLTPGQLAPADHRLAPIDVQVLVSDHADPHATFVLVSIESSDPDAGLGPDDLPKDVKEAEFGTGDTRFLLRAERGLRQARVYTIRYAATDAAGNSSARSAQVRVD